MTEHQLFCQHHFVLNVEHLLDVIVVLLLLWWPVNLVHGMGQWIPRSTRVGVQLDRGTDGQMDGQTQGNYCLISFHISCSFVLFCFLCTSHSKHLTARDDQWRMADGELRTANSHWITRLSFNKIWNGHENENIAPYMYMHKYICMYVHTFKYTNVNVCVYCLHFQQRNANQKSFVCQAETSGTQSRLYLFIKNLHFTDIHRSNMNASQIIFWTLCVQSFTCDVKKYWILK